jgi:hypothetical protein
MGDCDHACDVDNRRVMFAAMGSKIASLLRVIKVVDAQHDWRD